MVEDCGRSRQEDGEHQSPQAGCEKISAMAIVLNNAPRANLVGRRFGSYLVEAEMNDGNVSRIIVWITDTTIVSKPLHQKTLYMIADAQSGTAVPEAKLDLFGYRTEYIGRNRNREKDRYYNVITTEATDVSDVDGLVQRDLRRWGGGRESSFVYHYAKKAALPLVVTSWVVYLALPFSLHPGFIVLPFAVLFALSVAVTASTFKKYL